MIEENLIQWKNIHYLYSLIDEVHMLEKRPNFSLRKSEKITYEIILIELNPAFQSVIDLDNKYSQLLTMVLYCMA